jgi:hypothetical protein
MPIIKEDDWDKWVKNNQDPYGKAICDVARKVMEILDVEQEFDTYKIICRADEEINAGGITGFMAGAVASMVSHCHSRGEEFRKKWNADNKIGEKEYDGDGVINPALITISV